ncbi:MAG: hypothetical protein RL591_36 [Planctomycetota bacterium]
MPDSTRIVRVEPARLEEAMSALLGAGPAAAKRFVEQARASRVVLDYLWCLTDAHGRYRAAVLAVPSPGRASMLLATRARDREDATQFGPLIAEAATGSASFADIAQALVEPARTHDIAAYECGGLSRMAELEYLERSLPRAGILEPSPVPPGWSIEPVADPAELARETPDGLAQSTRAALIAALERSYLDTLDCPGLAGMRATRDVLLGHFGTGARTRHWLVARQLDANHHASHDANHDASHNASLNANRSANHDRDTRERPLSHDSSSEAARGDSQELRTREQIHARGTVQGVCLMNVTPDGSDAELVYLGLAPEARGKGIGQALLTHGLHACSRSRCASVSLAVDTRNVFARRLYETNGFRRVSTRIALVRKTHASSM